MASTNCHFTLTTDWLAFTIPSCSLAEVKRHLGGEWTQGKGGFRGYPLSWVLADGSRGVGKLGTGAPRSPKEVHVDLSAGIVSTWPIDQVKQVLRWLFEQQGHLTRIDCALDDRKGLVSLEQIKQAVAAGQSLTRAEAFKVVAGSNIDTGVGTGETLYVGSPQSQTMLRIYDKRAELQQKGHDHWQDYGIRWELQLRDERADLCGRLLCSLDTEEWCRFVVGVLRAYINFRDTTRQEPPWTRCRAPLLPWWEELTSGLEQCRLTVEKELKNLDQVKAWATQSLAPMLAVLQEGAGEDWMKHLLEEGKRRWRPRHRQLLKGGRGKRAFGL